MTKKEKRIALCVLATLLCLYSGLSVYTWCMPKDAVTVENRRDSIYLKECLPPQPEGADININTADAALLDTLPGIGKVLAERIVSYREETGAFPHPGCIMEVQGIGEATYAKIAARLYAE